MSKTEGPDFRERYVKPVVRAVLGWGFHFPLSYLSTEWEEGVKPWLVSKGHAFNRGIEKLRPKKDDEPRSGD